MFSSPRAEDESEWLIGEAFVLPSDFGAITGNHCVALFGPEGMGKTAFHLALERYAAFEPTRLVVNWQLDRLDCEEGPSTLQSYKLFAKILGLCAEKILEFIFQYPDVYLGVDKGTQKELGEFIIRFIDEDIGEAIQLYPLETESHQQVKQIMIGFTPRPLSLLEEPYSRLVSDMVAALAMIGFPGGVWILGDFRIRQLDISLDRYVSCIKGFFSTLALFEVSNFYYKLTLPQELYNDLFKSSAKVRDRIQIINIEWSEDQLIEMLETRLGMLTGNSNSKLADVYDAEILIEWLKKCGGSKPRYWITYFQKFAAIYKEILDAGESRQLTKEEWDKAIRESAVPLEYFPEESKFQIGAGMKISLTTGVKCIVCLFVYKKPKDN